LTLLLLDKQLLDVITPR